MHPGQSFKSIEKKFCSTLNHLDQVLDYLDSTLKATIKPAGEANVGQSPEDVPMEVDRDVTDDINPSNQVSSFDPTSNEWEVINPSSFHWPQILPYARAQSTVTELRYLGDQSGHGPQRGGSLWVS